MKPRRSSSRKKWNVFAYFGGDNNLSEEMVWGLQEMRRAASVPEIAEAVNVVVLFDPKGDNPRRYEIVTPEGRPEDGADGGLEAASTPAVDGGAGTVVGILGRFLAAEMRKLPRTPHCAVVLSGHGSGAVGDFLLDEEPASALSIPRLGKILDRSRARVGAKIDILGLDSCQMSTVEVGFEVRDSVQYLVASEGLVLNAGWPYHRVLEVLAGNGTASVADRARALAARYLSFYRDYEVAGLSTDIAVTDVSRLEPLADRVRELAEALLEPLRRLAADGIEEAFELGELQRATPDAAADGARSIRDAIVLAHWSAQSYKCDRFVDLLDFAEQLLRFGRGRGDDDVAARIREAARRLRDAVDEAVVAAGTTGAEFQHSRGVSIYFPWSSRDYLREYRNLAFAQRSKWADFLETYLKVTMRMRRFQRAHMIAAPAGLRPPGFGQARRSSAEAAGHAVALDEKLRAVSPAPPRRRPESSLVAVRDVEAGTHRDVEAGTHRDVEAGTHRDVEAGTHRGKACASTMKNPPEGHYEASRPSESDERSST